MNSFAEQTSEAHKLSQSRQLLTFADVDAIGSLVERIRATDYLIAVDLGAGSGTTALSALCARRDAVVNAELRMRVFSFDVDQGALDWTQEAMKNAGFAGHWRGFQIAAQAGARHWDKAHRAEIYDLGTVVGHQWVGVDLLLHDAGHDSGDVYGDLVAWLPKLVPGGLVWTHDYTDAYPGVVADIDRLVAEGLLVEGGGAVGLGWTGMKPKEEDDGND